MGNLKASSFISLFIYSLSSQASSLNSLKKNMSLEVVFSKLRDRPTATDRAHTRS